MSSMERTPPPTVSGMKHSSASSSTRAKSGGGPPRVAVMSRNTSSSTLPPVVDLDRLHRAADAPPRVEPTPLTRPTSCSSSVGMTRTLVGIARAKGQNCSGAEPGPLALLGVELHPEDGVAGTAETKPPAVRRRAPTTSVGRRRHASGSCGRSRSRPGSMSRRTAGTRCSGPTSFQPMCGIRGSAPVGFEAPDLARDEAQAPRSRRLPTRLLASSCIPRQIPRSGTCCRTPARASTSSRPRCRICASRRRRRPPPAGSAVGSRGRRSDHVGRRLALRTAASRTSRLHMPSRCRIRCTVVD